MAAYTGPYTHDDYAKEESGNCQQQAPAAGFIYGAAPPPPYNANNQQYVAYYAAGNNQYGQQPVFEGVPDTATQTNNPNVVVITQPSQPYVPAVKNNFCCQYFFSCMVFWFCWVLFGGIAFILTAIASRKYNERDLNGARKFSSAATAMNVIGLLLGGAAWGVMIWWLVTYVGYCVWSFYGLCYRYRYCYNTYSQCLSMNGLYYNSCCYYN